MIYADHAATTALSAAAFAAMEPYLHHAYGNPSTLYSLAREPHKAICDARAVIAKVIGAEPEEIYFTSGGTEADNWAIKGIAIEHGMKAHVVTSQVEHHAVLNTCATLERLGCSLTRLPVDQKGIVCLEEFEQTMSYRPILASVMLANNEIGTIEPIRQLRDIAHQHGCLFHTDAVQAVGHIPVNVKELAVDMLSASAHKFNGPKGIGFLYIRRGVPIVPLLDGGGQERGMRAGTENTVGIVGMAAALQEHAAHLDQEAAYLERLRDALLEQLHQYHLDFLSNGAELRIPGSLSLSFKNVDGEMLMHRLDLMGTAVATGSACDSKNTILSHVIKAIGIPQEYANGTIRVTLGMDNTMEQMNTIASQIKQIIMH